ncbi:fasciclin domain-containing protein [Streptomyces sp. NPDC058375]|uniref:fasciclin domain-containing protein n=1 Tax=Streptomyces sp. NPDC058375 TaxID=3346467 RepID=UPI00365E4447
MTTITRLQRTAAAAAALALPASPAFFAPQAQAAATADPYGPACASVPKEGAGSLEGMAKDPAATAASNNPELSTLVDAVIKAGLVDTLNKAENITVFAPTDAAFEKIPQADLEALLNDKDRLTKVLTYHVVGEKVTTQQMEDGTFKTLEGSDLTTKGSGTAFTVNDSSKIVCGDAPTANATVNLVDTVLMPPS